jgi:tRNA nucleotidyltransferase/poly(A) polymerase
MLKASCHWETPTLPVQGEDVLARGIEEGREVGHLLKVVEDWWVEQDFAPDRADLLKKLDALVGERRRE